MKYRRSRTEIVVQILEITNRGSSFTDYEGETDDGVLKTKMMYKALLLSYAQLKEYLKLLAEHGLLSYDSASGKFKTTNKGRRLVEIFNNMNGVIKEEGV